MKTLLLLTCALALQVASAQPEPKSTWTSAEAVKVLVMMVCSPTVHKGKGVVSQRPPTLSDHPLEYAATTTVSADFGIGMAYRMKDGTIVRILEESDEKGLVRKGLEIWWPCPEIESVPNVLTVLSDGSYGYCRIGGKVRYPFEVTTPDDPEVLTKESVDEAFQKRSAALMEHLAPAE